MTTKNRPIRLYGAASFDRGGKVRWLLQLNPMGRVPVAEIGDQVMFESGAICAYLADLYLDKGMAPALTAPERTEYQKWMYFASATVDSIQSRIMIIEDIPPGDVQRSKEKALQGELRDSLEA